MGNITVVGFGWRAGQLTFEAAEALTGGDHVILHTDHCNCAAWLREKGVAFETLDGLYEEIEDFDAHAETAARAVLEASCAGDVVYGVFDVRDRSVVKLSSLAPLRVLAGPPTEGPLLALASGEARCVEASDWETFHLTARENCFVREIDSRELACEVKLRLMEVYPAVSSCRYRHWTEYNGCCRRSPDAVHRRLRPGSDRDRSRYLCGTETPFRQRPDPAEPPDTTDLQPGSHCRRYRQRRAGSGEGEKQTAAQGAEKGFGIFFSSYPPAKLISKIYIEICS